jgi:hypothetical protein
VSIASGAASWGQSLAESLMVDTVRIRRKSGTVWDDASGQNVPSYVTVYEGKCRLVLRSGVVRDVDAQSQLLSVQTPELHVPVTAAGVLPDDEFEMLTGDDSGLSGRVSGVFPQTLKTARRLPVVIAS